MIKNIVSASLFDDALILDRSFSGQARTAESSQRTEPEAAADENPTGRGRNPLRRSSVSSHCLIIDFCAELLLAQIKFNMLISL